MSDLVPPRRPGPLPQNALAAMSYKEKKAENDKRIARNTKRAMIKALKASNPHAEIPSMFLEAGFTGMSDDEDEIDITGHIRADSALSQEEMFEKDNDPDDEETRRLDEEQRRLEEERRLADDLLNRDDDDPDQEGARLGPMSPASVKRAIANAIANVMGGMLGIGSKRSSSAKSADESEFSKKKPRTDREEVDLAIGELSRPEVPDDYFTLWHAKEHLPISLFSLESLRLVHSKANSLRTVKNTFDRKGPKLINTEDSRFQSEDTLDYASWSGAIGTFLAFAKSLDKKGTAQKWYYHHFEFCTELVVTRHEDWEVVRSFDIATRKEYHMSPFRFGHDTHHSRFLAHERLLQRTANRQSVPSSSRASAPSGSRREPAPYTHSSSRQPFQSRQPGPKTTSVCLICGNQGHRSDVCRVQKLRGTDKPTFARFSNGKLVSVRDANPICAPWNVSGNFGARCGQHNRAEHACSFCGKLDHHATSWSCLPNPNAA